MERVLVRSDLPNYSVDPETGDIIIRPRERLLHRDDPTVSRVQALKTVHERLAADTEIFQNYGDGGRRGAYRALSHVIECLTSTGIPYATLRPLEAIMAAFSDADRGVASELFKPIRPRASGGRGRPAKPSSQREFEGLLAVIAECCIQHTKVQGHRNYKVQGIALAAKLVNASKWPTRITAGKLAKIRENVASASRKAPERWFWDATYASPGFHADPLGWAKQTLQNQLVNPPPKESE